MTIPVESTGGEVLAVPVSALTMGPDGSSRVLLDPATGDEFVTVDPGLSADGYVAITPIDGSLKAGDLVVVGFEQTGGSRRLECHGDLEWVTSPE